VGHSGTQTHILNQHAIVMRLYFLFLPTPETPAQEISTRLFFFCNPLSFRLIRSFLLAPSSQQHSSAILAICQPLQRELRKDYLTVSRSASFVQTADIAIRQDRQAGVG
jgi:hypothetical protein